MVRGRWFPIAPSNSDGECAFCQRNSSTCVALGHEWQYADVDERDLIPQGFNDLKQGKDGPLTLDAPSYYVDTSPDPPYCRK